VLHELTDIETFSMIGGCLNYFIVIDYENLVLEPGTPIVPFLW
jgi:hypothetical protein